MVVVVEAEHFPGSICVMLPRDNATQADMPVLCYIYI